MALAVASGPISKEHALEAVWNQSDYEGLNFTIRCPWCRASFGGCGFSATAAATTHVDKIAAELGKWVAKVRAAQSGVECPAFPGE